MDVPHATARAETPSAVVSLAKKFAFAELTEANNVTETSKKLIDTLKGELTTATSKIEELEKLQVRLDEKLAEALEKLRTGSAKRSLE